MWLTTAVCVHFLSPLSKNYQLLLYYTRAMPVNRYRVYFVKRPKIYPHAFAARQSNTAPRQTLFRPGHIEQHIDDPAVSAAVGEPWYKIGIVVAIAFADVIFGGHRIAELRFERFLRLRAPPLFQKDFKPHLFDETGVPDMPRPRIPLMSRQQPAVHESVQSVAEHTAVLIVIFNPARRIAFRFAYAQNPRRGRARGACTPLRRARCCSAIRPAWG